mmetsp:Transcript_14648/g.51471  ORF Transcript_14648/g.51471 Transcript_14648/m.51471 type:complete len:89 (-) Transcript_14648:78-344(-)
MEVSSRKFSPKTSVFGEGKDELSLKCFDDSTEGDKQISISADPPRVFGRGTPEVSTPHFSVRCVAFQVARHNDCLACSGVVCLFETTG